MSQPSPSGKRILSVDGGGFRGLGSLLVIEAIVNAAHVLCRTNEDPLLRPCEVFDLMCGSSTGGLLVVLLGSLGLDCSTAIKEYKNLAKALFGDDRKAFLDIVTNAKSGLDQIAYEDALADVVARHGGDKDLPFSLPEGDPKGNAQAAVMTMKKGSSTSQFTLSWKQRFSESHTWLVREVARQTTAAPIYVSPLQVIDKDKPDDYIDAAFSGFINPTAAAVARKLWNPKEPNVVVSIGQGFSALAIKGKKPGHPTDKDAQPFVADLISTYTLKSTDARALAVVKQILLQGANTVEVNNKVSQIIDNYYRVDPPLGIGRWELVDHFCPDTEDNVKKWLASSEGKAIIDGIATTLVMEKKPTNPADVTPPSAPEGTLKPNRQCEQPRPKDMVEYLKNYHVIFVVDDSTSMIYYGNRWNEARDALLPIADFALEHEVDTIDMCFLNSERVCNAVKDSDYIMQVFDETRPPIPPPLQYTPTGECLEKILNDAIGRLDAAIHDPIAYQQIRPFDIVLLTDGDPTDEPQPVLEAAWARLQANKHHPNYIGVQIVQIGDDAKATEKLKELMNGNIGSIVDTVPHDGIVTPEKLQRILLGGLQPNVRALYS